MQKNFLAVFFIVTFFVTANGQTNVSGNQSGTWTLAGSPYILSGTVTVPAGQTLTIQPGVVVEFPRYDYSLWIDGVLQAHGTSSDSIRFRGKANLAFSSSSTHGGAIYFNNTVNQSTLDYVSVDSLGDLEGIGNTGAISIPLNAKPIISHSRILHTEASSDIYTWLGGGEFITNNSDIVVGLQPGSSYTGNNILAKPGNNSYYKLLGYIAVNNGSSLTIQPGVVIQFPRYDYTLSMYGTLTAIGTISDSIKFIGKSNFTYDPNSSHGGGLTLGDTATLQYVVIDSMGDAQYYQYAVNITGSKNVSITNSSIRNSEDVGIYINQNQRPVISSCSIGRNGGVDISTWLGGGEFITNNNGIVVGLQANNFYEGANVLAKPGNDSYYKLLGYIGVNNGSSLTIQPGVVIQFPRFDYALSMNGKLTAIGTVSDSIKFIGKSNFTYDPNSSHGGGLTLGDTATLQYVAIDSMGDAQYYQYGVNITGSESVSITNSSIRNSEDVGIYIGTEQNPVISSCAIGGNEGLDISTWIGGSKFITNNNDIVVGLQAGSASDSCTLAKPGIGSHYTLLGSIDVPGLTIQPGTEIQFPRYDYLLTINGAFSAIGTSTDSIRFIGKPNVAYDPNSSHGGTIRLNGPATLQYTVIDRMGDAQVYGYALGVFGNNISITQSSIRNNEGTGIQIVPTRKPVISSCAMGRNGNLDIVTWLGGAQFITGNDNIVVGLGDGSGTSSCVLAKPGANSYYRLLGSISIVPTINLTIQAGVEIQFPRYDYSINIAGTLTAIGTPTDSIRFTGKANLNYNPNSSHGGAIIVNGYLAGATLQYVAIDNMGDAQTFGYGLLVSSLHGSSITNCSIRNSESTAIEVGSFWSQEDHFDLPIIQNNAFSNTGKDIHSNISLLPSIANNQNAKIYLLPATIDSNVLIHQPGANSRYVLEGSITINQGKELTIEPGTQIDFRDYQGNILVNGTLTAQGTETAPIQFVKLPGSGASNYGGSVTITGNSTNSHLSYVNFNKLGSSSSNPYALATFTSDVALSHITISNSENIGLQLYNASPTVNVASIFGNVTGVSSMGGRALFNNCNIYDNTSKGVENVSGVIADTIDARNCWWGNVTGPFHAVDNPSGLGNSVSDRVLFNPWRTEPAGNFINDIGVSAVLSPLSSCTTVDSPEVKVRIYNYGNTAQTGFNVSYRINNGSIVTENVGSLSIGGFAYADYTFNQNANISSAGSYYAVKAYTSLNTDTTVTNDTATAIVFVASLTGPINLLPADSAVNINKPISFSWSPVTNALSYNLFVWPVAGTMPSVPSISGISGTSYVYNDTSLHFGQTYKWKVRATRDSCFTESNVQRLTLKNLPDLNVQSVTSGNTIIAPGDTVTVSWHVGNVGAMSSPINWTERIYMQSAAGENRTLLKQIDFSDSNTLATGGSIARNEQIVMPSQLYIGDEGVFVVEVLPGAGIQEIVDSNNIGIQTTHWTVKKVLTLELSASQITEGSQNGVTGIINRTGSLNDALTVNINAGSSSLSFPSSVVIPANAAGTSFTISAIENSTIEGTKMDTFIVSALNFQPDSATLSVIDNDDATLSVVNLPLQAMEGDTVVFNITTNHASSSPQQVFLTSGNQARFPLPNSITIPADSLSKTITVILQQDNLPEIETTVNITAGAANHTPLDTSIQINDDDVPNIELVLQTDLVSESAGLYATQATLRRTSPDNSIAFTANLSASMPGVLILPSSISLAAGETEKTFTIGVTDNTLVDTLRPVTITASVFVSTCGCSAPPTSAGTVSVVLNVSDNDGPSLQVTVVPQTLPEGAANAGSLRVTRNTSTTSSLLVDLSSSDTTEAKVPLTALIPVNQTYVDVPVTTIDDDTTDGNQTVFLEASSAGYSTGVTWIVVSDQNKPDLMIPSVIISDTSVQSGEIVSYQVSVKNNGSATAPGGVLVRGYLSLDDVIDNTDTIITQQTIPSPLQAGQTVQVLNAFMVPDKPGNHKLLFAVNPDLLVTEFQTTNNTAAPVNLHIVPAYTATANVSLTFFLKGVSVPISGIATKTDGSPAINKPVDVFVIVNGLPRKIVANTNATGNYSTQFTPLANEAGHFTVSACYPGMNDTTAQDAFDILGVKINAGAIPQFHVLVSNTITGALPVQNLSNKSLTHFTLNPVTVPGGASIHFDTIAVLPGNSTANISYTVTGSTVSSGSNFQNVSLEAIANEGIIQPADAYYFCQAPNAYIVSNTTAIHVNVSQSSGEKLVELKLVNQGLASTGIIHVDLPLADWLSSVTPVNLPSIVSGDTTIVVLRFRALPEVPLNYSFQGTIGITSQNGNSLSVPFTFEKVASSTGTVKITATNQFTYYTATGPKVSGAFVKIKNYYTGVVLAQGYTDSAGVFIADGIPEGSHRITVEKDKHLPYSNIIIVDPGDTTSSVVFLNYQAITFNWNVVPTGIQDQYTITLTSQFETNIPIPVVTVDMPSTMPPLSLDQSYSFVVTLTNRGLITAKEVALNLPIDDPEYEFITNYTPIDINAQQSIQVPVLMRRRAVILGSGRTGSSSVEAMSRFLGIASPSVQGTNCIGFAGVAYFYYCNIFTGLVEQSGFQFGYGGRVCVPTGGGNGQISDGDLALYDWWLGWLANWGGPGSGGGGGGIRPPCAVHCDTSGNTGGNVGTPPRPPVNEQESKNCDECRKNVGDNIKGLAEAALSKIGDWGLAAAIAAAPVAALGGLTAAEATAAALALKGGLEILKCLVDEGGDYINGTGSGISVAGCLPPFEDISDLKDLLDLLSSCFAVDFSGRQTSTGSANGRVRSLGSFYKQQGDNLQIAYNYANARNKWAIEYFENLVEKQGWHDLSVKLESYVQNIDSIPSTAQSSILAEMDGYAISSSAIQHFFDRWNTSIHALRNNVLHPNSEYPNIINWENVKSYSDSIISTNAASISRGFESIQDMYAGSLIAIDSSLQGEANSVCAAVTVQFSQQLTMTREAFEGTLGIFNGHPTDAMDSITVNIQITDQAGVSANSLFEIQTTDLTNLANVTGTGAIDAQETGSVKFLFIPKISAAPTVPKTYRFGGSITYWDPYVQAMVTFPLNAIPITVNPSPNLALHYFMQRNILGDDALTSPDIEPSVPAELGVMVENQGYGSAVNLTISSSQPKIIDNEKGLAIDFNLIGSNFQGQPRNLGVTDINFGTIPPLQARIGEWYFTSSLLGKFVSYSANVVHNNSFGNPELSLINSVKLHELTKSIHEYGAQDDNINDFLVNDIFDVNDYPDIIYFSQGNRTDPVHPAASGSFSAPVSGPLFRNVLTVAASDTGWNYIKLNDPGNGLYTIDSVIRSDGQVIPLDNAWLTFVTLPVGKPPVYENKFHIVDSFRSSSPVTYTVVWKPKNFNVPKVDSITGTPVQTITTAVQHVRVIFNKRIDPATFTYNDLTLTLAGGLDIMNSSVVITQIDTATFDVDLSALTTGDGLYAFTAQAANVTDIYGINGLVGKQVSWTQFLNVPAIQAFAGIPANGIDTAYERIQVLFNLPIDQASVTPQRFSITKNGTPQSGSLTIDSVRSDHKLFYLSGLKNILTTSGDYVLTVDVPQIRTLNNIYGVQAQSITLKLDNTGPLVVSLIKSDSGALDLQHVTFVKINLSEDVVPFNISAVKLTRNADVLPLNISHLTNLDFKSWLAGNFGVLTYPEGNYTFTIILDSLRDKAGNKGAGSQQISWTVDRSTAIAITNLSVAPDLGFSNSDGITSGQSFNVSFNLNTNASQVKVLQFDLSGENVLTVIPSAIAGNVSVPVNLPTGGNTGIKVTAIGNNGVMGTVQKTIFVDQVPLTAQWLLAPNQTVIRQPDTIGIKFSSKLIGTTGFIAAVELRKDGLVIPSNGVLNFESLNDSMFNVRGFRQASTDPGDYSLSFNTQSFSKYSSGKNGNGVASLQWTVKSPNRAPIANAGNDTVITSAGNIILNGSKSSDPDLDSLSYKWTAPASISLNDSSSVTPSVIIPGGNNGSSYSFLLIVKDGALFSTDVVNVSLNYSICPGSDMYFTLAKPGDGYTYQWQVDSTGTGFVNLFADGFHSGVNADTLRLTAPPSSYYGYRYRCVATKGSFTVYGAAYTLRFAVVWDGNTNTTWNNAANWNCNSIPDQYADVIIPSGKLNYPVISNNTSCHSIIASPGTTITVAAGVRLTINGK